MSILATHGNRLHSLDFLRGVAVLSVVAFHCAMSGASGISAVDTLFGMGKLGVQLFFLISAMTMCHMWEQRSDESHRTAKFYIRRFMRIAPLFWLAIIMYISTYGLQPSQWAHDGMTPLDIVLTALFLHNFWPHAVNNVVPGGWSIAVEMMFYALFPLLISRAGSNRKIYLALAAVLIFAYQFWLRGWLTEALGSGDPEQADTFLFFNFINQCPVFLIGCYLHFALRSGIDRMEMLAICAIALATWSFDQPFPLICISLSALVFLLMRCEPRWALLETFGLNSYAIYLVHFIVIEGVMLVIPGEPGLLNLLIRFFAVALLSYGLARLLHLIIERPVAGLTKKMVRYLDRDSSESKLKLV